MKVLIALDEYNFANAIVDFMANHQWSGTPDVKLVHVVEPASKGNYMSVLPRDVLNDLYEEQLDFGRKLVRKVALKLNSIFHSTHIEEEVVEGNPKEEILNRANQWGADLIIVGSHGRSGMSKIILGSVSQTVAAAAPCAVLIVRPQEVGEEHEPALVESKELVL